MGSDRDPDTRLAAELVVAVGSHPCESLPRWCGQERKVVTQCREHGGFVRSGYQPLGELAVCSPGSNCAVDGLVVQTESGNESVWSLRAVVADPDVTAGKQRGLSQWVVG